MKSLIRHPFRIGLAAILLAAAAGASAASSHPTALAVDSVGSRALIRVADSHGKTLLASVIRTAILDRSRLESMTKSVEAGVPVAPYTIARSLAPS